MSKEFTIKNLRKEQFVPFQVSEEEIISFALDESALIDDDTTINDMSARELVKSFYEKRENFRENTRLGHILVREYQISKEDLLKALNYHQDNSVPLGRAFIELEICTDQQIEEALRKQAQMRSYIR